MSCTVLFVNSTEAIENNPVANQSIQNREIYGFRWDAEVNGVLKAVYVSPDGEIILVNDGLEYDNIFSFNKKGILSWKYELNLTYGMSSGGDDERRSASSNFSYIAVADMYKVYLFSKEKGFLWKYELDKQIIVNNYANNDQVLISSDGSFITVKWGNNGARINIIYFFNKDGDLLWKYETEANTTIPEIAMSSDGSYIAAVFRSKDSLDYKYEIDLFNKEGEILWKRPWIPETIKLRNASRMPWDFFRKLSITANGSYIVTAGTIEREYLFSWDDVPGNDNARLIEFLKKRFGIDWVETAKIEKIDDGKTIRVSTEKNSLSLRLNYNVDLVIDDGRTDVFSSLYENGKRSIYDSTPISEVNLINKEGEFIWNYILENGINEYGDGISVSSEGSTMVVDRYEGIIYFFNRMGNLLRRYQTSKFNAFSISSDGSNIVTGGDDGNVSFFNKEGEILWKYRGKEKNYVISRIYASPDLSYIAVEDSQKILNIFNKEGNLIGKYEPGIITDQISLSSDGSFIVIVTGESFNKLKIIFLEKVSRFTKKKEWIEMGNVSIFDYGTAKDFDINPINITNNFESSDSTIHLWSYLGVSSLGNELKWKIYSPDGILYYNPSMLLDQYYIPANPGTENISNIYTLHYTIPIEKIIDKPGEWRAELYINDEKTATHTFDIPGTISAKIYPAIGITLAAFPLLSAIFIAMKIRKKQAKQRVGLIENWKTNGIIIGHSITIIWTLILIAFLFINKFLNGEINVILSYGFLLTSIFFCYLSTRMIINFFTYRKLSQNDLYFNGALSVSISLFALFSGMFVPASIYKAALLSLGIVLIPLFSPNFISLSVVRKNGELLLAKEAKIPVTPTFPQELYRFYRDAEYIGGGGFAWVFRATRKDGEKVAIKIPAIKDENTGNLFLTQVSHSKIETTIKHPCAFQSLADFWS